MDDSQSQTQSDSLPPDWSQLSSLWQDQDNAASSGNNTNNSQKPFNDFMDFDMASNILDMDLDMGLHNPNTAGIEPSALHLDSNGRLSYGYDDDFGVFPSSACSPADILAAQFPFTFNGDLLEPMHGTSGGGNSSADTTPNSKQRRLSITSSSSSSGPSFSPAPDSTPSPGYLSNDYTSDSSFDNNSNNSFTSHTSSAINSDQPSFLHNAHSHEQQDYSNDPAAELAHRVRQTAGVMLAVPMNGTHFQSDQFHSHQPLQAKLPIPRLQRPSLTPVNSANSPPKSNSPSTASSVASTPPPCTPPPGTPVTTVSSDGTVAASIPSIPISLAARPKTSHTTIERRYRTNLNARIQSLRMAVPALRVLEDRDSGSSKKIKKNLKGGVLIKSASANSPNGVGTVIAVPGAPTASNPYGEVDVIDERGYVDGVKVARKCSKANVLGKAVEYIRVLKRRELRLRAEQTGLKTLVCGLVGGPALLREWEREWRERFGGEEKDEVDGDGDVEDEEEDDEEDDDDDDEGDAGRKRKRVKADKDTIVQTLPKKEPKPPLPVTIGPDGQPERRKRGRPRKLPLPSVAAPAPVATLEQQHQQQPQQYMLAVFALFSFFNSPLTSTSQATTHAHTHKGHVWSPSSVPLAYSPEIVSQFSPPPVEVGMTWRDWIQIVHLAVTVLLFLSVIGRLAGGLGLNRIRHFVKASSSTITSKDAEKKMERITLGTDEVPSFTNSVSLYRSLSSNSSVVTQSFFLFTLASVSSSSIMKHVLKMRARALWNSAIPHNKREEVVLAVPIDDAYILVSSLSSKDILLDDLAAYMVNLKLGSALEKMFVNAVSGGSTEKESKEIDTVIEAAKELGGDISSLAKSVDAVRKSKGLDASLLSESDSDEEWDNSSSTELSLSVTSFDDLDDEDQTENTPGTLLKALVLYRSLFGSPSLSTAIEKKKGVDISVQIIPPTPTVASASLKVEDAEKRMYELRKLLGSRVFESEEVEEARDQLVDLIVEAERKLVLRV